MKSKPTIKEIAEATGLTENEVGAYFADSELRSDGTWLIYFDPGIFDDPLISERLRDDLKGFFTYVMPFKAVSK
jgi:hypothetical protein